MSNSARGLYRGSSGTALVRCNVTQVHSSLLISQAERISAAAKSLKARRVMQKEQSDSLHNSVATTSRPYSLTPDPPALHLLGLLGSSGSGEDDDSTSISLAAERMRSTSAKFTSSGLAGEECMSSAVSELRVGACAGARFGEGVVLEL